jgi:hypothetical protein
MVEGSWQKEAAEFFSNFRLLGADHFAVIHAGAILKGWR